MKTRFIDRSQNKPQTLFAGLESALNTHPGLVTQELTALVVASESIGETGKASLQTSMESIDNMLQTTLRNLNMVDKFKDHGLDAAIEGIALSGDLRAALRRKLDLQTVSTESVAVANPAAKNATRDMALSLEAYDEAETRRAQLFSAYFNLTMTRQSEFNETIWPMIVLPSDQVGLGITVDLMMVFNRVLRKIDASVADFGFRNIIRAYADSTILAREQTRATPRFRNQEADKFVDQGIIPAYTTTLDQESFLTAPIKIDVEVDLIMLSMPDALLAQGTPDHRDALDPTLTISAVYIQFGDDVIKFPTQNYQTNNFYGPPQGNSRQLNLSMKVDSLPITAATKNVDGTALTTLASLTTNELAAHIGIELSGTVNVQSGRLRVFGPKPVLRHLREAGDGGEDVPVTSNPGLALKALVEAGVVLGYDVKAWRTNSNQRQDGQRIDTQRYTQLYNVPLLNPIFTEHPISQDQAASASDVNALIASTRIRIENDGVTALLDTFATMRDYVASNSKDGLDPKVGGVGAFFVKPTYRSFNLDVAKISSSQDSNEAMVNIRESLLNVVRYLAFTLYTESEYKAANDLLSGGMAGLPEVVVATDPTIAAFLVNFGDLRDLNARFKLRVVESLDYRLRGKAFVMFTRFGEDRNTTPHPLNFGNLIWAPETVVTGNLHRDGATSRDTIVNPRYLFVAHCPIGAELTITGLADAVTDVTQKLAIDGDVGIIDNTPPAPTPAPSPSPSPSPSPAPAPSGP